MLQVHEQDLLDKRFKTGGNKMNNKLYCEMTYWERIKEANQKRWYWKLFMALVDRNHEAKKQDLKSLRINAERLEELK